MPKGRKPKKNIEDIDPKLLPPEIVTINPHNHIKDYFSLENKNEIIEKWVDFYSKRPKIGIKELIGVTICLPS